MKSWVFSSLVSIILVGGSSHYIRTYWQDYQSAIVEKARQTELLRHYQGQLNMLDEQLAMRDQTHAALVEEKTILEANLQISNTKADNLIKELSNEVNQCFELYIAADLIN